MSITYALALFGCTKAAAFNSGNVLAVAQVLGNP
jgi:hypothetical protein